MLEWPERVKEAERLEAELAKACGMLNAAAARLVELLAEAVENEVWEAAGIHSAEAWVAWQCGVSGSRARSLVRTARRMAELPETRAAFCAGELSEDQVAVVARHAPASVDAEVAELARSATVGQLRRVLGKYSFAATKPAPEPEPEPAEEPRRVSFGHDDEGSWRLSACLPADEGAVVEAALRAARSELFDEREHPGGPGPCPADVSWADALVAMAEKSVAAEAVRRPHRDRHLVLLHLGTDGNGRLHLGPGVSDGMTRFLSCDARVRAVFEEAGRPVSVGRAFRTVPDRTRVVIEERDGGCRVPGCERKRWLHVHHVEHWEDGGSTDTANLIALCSFHHRLHHRGRLGISGNADDPGGVVFTDIWGRPLRPCGHPVPPGHEPLPQGTYVHPTGERLDPHWVYFNEPAEPAPFDGDYIYIDENDEVVSVPAWSQETAC